MSHPSAMSDADLVAALVQEYCDYRRMHRELLAAVEAEEARAGVTDQLHFDYPKFCTAGRIRLGKLDAASEEIAERIRSIGDRSDPADKEVAQAFAAALPRLLELERETA